MPAAVVVAGTGQEVLDELARRGATFVTCDDVEHAVRVTAGQDPLAVLLAGRQASLASAHRIRSVHPDVPVILVPEPDRREALDADVRFDPLVGRATACPACEGTDEVVDSLLAAAGREQRRRANERVLRHLAEVQLPAALSQPADPAQYLGQLLEHATIGVVTIDLDGTVRGWNPKAESITGRRQRDIVGAPIDTLFPAEEGMRVRVLLDRAARVRDALTEVFVRRGPAGEDQHLELTAASVDDGEGRLGTLALLNDATERVRAEQELATRSRNASLAGEVGMALTRDDPLEVQLKACAQAIVDNLDAAFARIWTLDPGGELLVLRASAGMYAHLDGQHSRLRVGDLKIGRIAGTRRPHLTNDVAHDPHFNDPVWAEREGIVSFAGYPLVVGPTLVGVLALFSRETLPAITLDSLASIADTIAVGIERATSRERVAELLEREHQAREEAERSLERYVALSRTLQQSLLPPALADVPGVDLAARYHWAGRGEIVGGDFYDAFRLPDGPVFVVMGDVSGKGVEAATISALARHTIRAAARVHRDPTLVLGMLNTILLEHTGGDRFCTVVVVTIEDPEAADRRVTITNAGHVFPVLVRGSGALSEAGQPGLPVGLFERLEVVRCQVDVAAGDTLVLFTDGVTEARRPTGEFQPDLVFEVLGRSTGASAAEVTSALEGAVLALQGGNPQDDVAVMAMRFTR